MQRPTNMFWFSTLSSALSSLHGCLCCAAALLLFCKMGSGCQPAITPPAQRTSKPCLLMQGHMAVLAANQPPLVPRSCSIG